MFSFHSPLSYGNLAFWSISILLSHLPTALSQLSVPLTFYTDNNCANPSTEHPNFSAALNECIVTTGLGSVSLPAVPCTSGSVNILFYSNSVCATSLEFFKLTDTCFGPISGDVAAVMVTCIQENDSGIIDASPTATTTVPVGPVAGGAVTTAAPNGGTVTATATTASGFTTVTTPASQSTSSSLELAATPSSTLSPSSTAFETITGSASHPTSTSLEPTATSSSPSPSSSSSSSSSSSGLSTSDIIALAVGLGMGVPSIIIGLLTLKNRRQTGQYLHGWTQWNAHGGYRNGRS